MAKTNTAVTRRTPTRTSRERESQRGSRRGSDRSSLSWNIPWTTPNFIGLGVGIVVIIIGYMLMKAGIADDPIKDKSMWNNSSSTSLAPVVLTIGYCIILPLAIFWRKKDAPEMGASDVAE